MSAIQTVKNFVSDHFKKCGAFLRHPIEGSKAYIAELKELDGKGKALKIAKTIGFILVTAVLLYYVLYVAIVLILAYIILGALLGSQPKEMTYYEMLQQQEKEEYEQRTGKPW